MLRSQLADEDHSACYTCMDGARDDHVGSDLVEARHTPSGGPPAPSGGFARGLVGARDGAGGRSEIFSRELVSFSLSRAANRSEHGLALVLHHVT
jgi:hypothetical protein